MKNHPPKFPQAILTILVFSLFILSGIPVFGVGTIPLEGFYLAQLLPILILLLILTLGIFITFPTKNLRISWTVVILLLISGFFGLQFAILKPTYTAPYLIALAIFLTFTLTLIIFNNLELSLAKFVHLAAIAILINCYLQILFTVFQLRHCPLAINFTLYGPRSIIAAQWHVFALPAYNRITGAIGQPNDLGDVLTWGLFANVWLFSSPTRTKRLIFALNLILIISFVALCESRTAYLYPLWFLVLGIVAIRSPEPVAKDYAKLLFITGCALIIALAGYHWWRHLQLSAIAIQHNLLPAKAQSAVDEQQALSINQRYYMWAKGISMFMLHPLIGVGWGQYFQNFLQTKTWLNGGIGELVAVYNCHNLVVQLLATTGIIGLLLVGIFFTYQFYSVAKLPLGFKILILGISLTTLTHSMFEYPLFKTYILLPLSLLLCIPDKSQIPRWQLSTRKFKLILIPFVMFGYWQSYVGVYNFLLLGQLIKPAHYKLGNIVDNSVSVYSRVVTNPFWDDLADFVLVHNLMFNARLKQNQEYFDLYYLTLHRAATYTPNPEFVLRLAILDMAKGQPEPAQAALNLLLANYPGHRQDFANYLKINSQGNPQLQAQLAKLIRPVQK